MRNFRAVALMPFAAALLVLAASGCGGGADARLGRATVAIRFSAFTPEEVTVPAGTPVTFTLRNDDPIEHEWIVGPPDVHERHRTGTEPYHDQVPTEVTIPAFETRTTTIVFEPGEYQYICHLPGHEAYGMTGTVHVVEH